MTQPLPELPAEAAQALARGNKIEAVKVVREAYGCGLKEAKDIVEGHIAGGRRLPAGLQAPAANPADLPAEAAQALSEGRTIEAIRVVREARGCGLKEAKDIVDAFVAANPLLMNRSGLETTTVSGCGVVLILGGLLVFGIVLALLLLGRIF